MGKFPKGWYKQLHSSPQHAFDFFRSQGKFHKGKLEPDLYIVVVDRVIGYIVKRGVYVKNHLFFKCFTNYSRIYLYMAIEPLMTVY